MRNLFERSSYWHFVFDKWQRKGRTMKPPAKGSGAGARAPPAALTHGQPRAVGVFGPQVLFLCPIFYHIAYQTPLSSITNLLESG